MLSNKYTIQRINKNEIMLFALFKGKKVMGVRAGKIWGNTELIHANGVLEFHRIEFKAGYKCSEHEHRFKWNS